MNKLVFLGLLTNEAAARPPGGMSVYESRSPERERSHGCVCEIDTQSDKQRFTVRTWFPDCGGSGEAEGLAGVAVLVQGHPWADFLLAGGRPFFVAVGPLAAPTLGQALLSQPQRTTSQKHPDVRLATVKCHSRAQRT